MATTVTTDTVETFVECPVCNGWYTSLELHLKSWRQMFRSCRGNYTSESTSEQDLKHEELFAETFTRSNRKYVLLSQKQRAYWKRRNERETPTVLSCGHSTVAWTTDEIPIPVCTSCGLEPQ